MCLRWLIVCFLCGRYNISHFYKDRLRPLCPLGKIFHTLLKNLALVLWYLSNEYKRVEWLPVPKMSNTDDQIFLTKKQCIFCILVKGQLILKCLFGVFNFFQKLKKNTSHSSKNEFIHSFFGRIQGLTICFRNYRTFKKNSFFAIWGFLKIDIYFFL